MDGGTTWNANLVSVAERCREEVSHDTDIRIDILITKPFPVDRNDTNFNNAFSKFMRHRAIRNHAWYVNDVIEFTKKSFNDEITEITWRE